MEHKTGKGEVVKPGKSLSKAFIVSCQTPEACCPGKAAFNHPTPRQQNEAAFRLGVFNDFQLDAMCLRRFCSALACIALVNIRQLHSVPGELLYRFCQLLDLVSILLIGRADMQREQLAQRIDCRMHLAALASLRTVITSACSRLRVDCSVRLSSTTAVGCTSRPA